MSSEDGLTLHVFETELADVQTAETSVLLRIGRVVPGVQLIAPEHNGLDHVAPLSDLTLNTQLLLQEGSMDKTTKLLHNIRDVA